MTDIQQVKQRFSIIGNSPALDAAIERAVKVAPIDLSVLVTGESGSGKEFFPRIIHQYGARKHKNYIAVNCGAIPEGTIDSELFGHEKGSFTGAVSARKGYFEEADGGTVFLDEVAELPLTTQARLLRVLETGEFMKVGSSQVQHTNIRIVAATNVDLLQAVAKGKFREDLYYRLSTVQIKIPSLSERPDDIPLLARKFASDFSIKYLTPPISFSDDAKRVLTLYRWPGNVRQLKNVIDQLALFEAGREIDRMTVMEALPPVKPAGDALAPLANTPQEAERQLMWQMLVSLKNEVERLKASVEHPHGQVAGNATRFGTLPSLPMLTPSRQPGSPFSPMHAAESEEGEYEDALPRNTPPTSLEEAEREAVAAAIERNKGNKAKAAAELGISLRTLYRKISNS